MVKCSSLGCANRVQVDNFWAGPVWCADCAERARRGALVALGGPVNHLGGPDDDHYAKLGVQPIEATEAWSKHWPHGVAYHLGEAVAMIARCGTKGSTLRDLRKARWLLDRAISTLETGGTDGQGNG